MATVQQKRGTLAAFLALASSSSLVPGQVYHITDTRQVAIPTSTTAYDLWMRAGEQGIVVGQPAAPYVGQIWIAP